MTRHKAIANCLNICFNKQYDVLARFPECSNLRLGVYTPYAHEKSNQSLHNTLFRQSSLCRFRFLLVVKTYHKNDIETHFCERAQCSVKMVKKC